MIFNCGLDAVVMLNCVSGHVRRRQLVLQMQLTSLTSMMMPVEIPLVAYTVTLRVPIKIAHRTVFLARRTFLHQQHSWFRVTAYFVNIPVELVTV